MASKRNDGVNPHPVVSSRTTMKRHIITSFFLLFLAGCAVQSDSSNALTAWDDGATENRQLKQEELIRKQDAILRRQQREFEDLHIQEQVQDEYKRRNLRQSDDVGVDDYH